MKTNHVTSATIESSAVAKATIFVVWTGPDLEKARLIQTAATRPRLKAM
jgi:hypothetical protein